MFLSNTSIQGVSKMYTHLNNLNKYLTYSNGSCFVCGEAVVCMV